MSECSYHYSPDPGRSIKKKFRPQFPQLYFIFDLENVEQLVDEEDDKRPRSFNLGVLPSCLTT